MNAFQISPTRAEYARRAATSATRAQRAAAQYPNDRRLRSASEAAAACAEFARRTPTRRGAREWAREATRVARAAALHAAEMQARP